MNRNLLLKCAFALPILALPTVPFLQSQLSSSAYAYPYPYDLSPSGQVRGSLTAEITAAQTRSQRSLDDGLELANLAGAYLKMARVTGDDQWYEKAELTAQQSLENLPFNNDGALMALAKVAEARHDFAEAARLAQQAESGQAIATLVTAQLAMGDIVEARAAAEELVTFSPSMGSLTLRALARQAEGDLAGAQQDFEQAIAAEEPGEARGSALARTLLGQIYAEQGQIQPAEALYKTALEIAPGYPQALLNWAELKAEQQEYRAAEKLYAQVDDPLALLGLARLSAQQGQMEKARSQWAEVEVILRQKIAENPLDHRRELAVLLLERGDEADRAEAVALMQAEVENRRDAETLETLDWALAEASR